MATKKTQSSDKAKLPTDSKKEIGISSARILSSTAPSLISTYNLEERRVDDLKISDYRRMRDNDGEVQMLLNAVKNVILGGGFDIIDDPEWDDKENPSEEKLFIEKNLINPSWRGGMTNNINIVFMTMLRALEEGFIPHEIVYKLNDENQIILDKVIARTTKGDMTDFKILVDANNNFKGIYQRGTIGSEFKEVSIINNSDIHKVINVVFGAEYGSNYGRPALKSSWYHYDKAHKAMYLNHIGLELGVVKYRYVKKKAVGGGSDSQDTEVMDILDRTGVNSQILLPESAYELTFEEVTDAAVMAVGKEMIDYHTTQIAKTLLAQFIELGTSGNSGSRALSNDTMAFFKSGLQHIANILLENPWNILIADLIKLNFNRGIYPQLKWKPLQDTTTETLFTIFTELAKGNQITDALRAEVLGKVSDKMNFNTTEEEILKAMEAEKKEKMEQEKAMNDQKVALAKQSFKKPTNLAVYGVEETTVPDMDNMIERLMRPLYKDEEKVRLADISRKMDDVKSRASVILRQKLDRQKAQIIDNYVQAMRAGRSSIKHVTVDLEENTYSDELLNLFYELVESGKVFVANELGVSVPSTTATDRAFIKDRIDALTEEQSARLKFRLQNIASNGLLRKMAENQVKLLIEQEYDNFFDSILPPTLNAVVPEAMNFGRSISFSKNRDKIFAYRYTAVLDGRTTEYCRDMDGRIFQDTDSDFIMVSPPNHFGCRSIWTPITKKESENGNYQVNGKPSWLPVNSSISTFRDTNMSEVETRIVQHKEVSASNELPTHTDVTLTEDIQDVVNLLGKLTILEEKKKEQSDKVINESILNSINAINE
jgi:SPP1 gp7 family putative phage head morphogenesis protein